MLISSNWWTMGRNSVLGFLFHKCLYFSRHIFWFYIIFSDFDIIIYSSITLRIPKLMWEQNTGLNIKENCETENQELYYFSLFKFFYQEPTVISINFNNWWCTVYLIYKIKIAGRFIYRAQHNVLTIFMWLL